VRTSGRRHHRSRRRRSENHEQQVWVWPGLISVMRSCQWGHEAVISKQRRATLLVSQGTVFLQLTARERRTTLWLVCSVIECAIRTARPPVLQRLAKSIFPCLEDENKRLCCIEVQQSSKAIHSGAFLASKVKHTANELAQFLHRRMTTQFSTPATAIRIVGIFLAVCKFDIGEDPSRTESGGTTCYKQSQEERK